MPPPNQPFSEITFANQPQRRHQSSHSGVHRCILYIIAYIPEIYTLSEQLCIKGSVMLGQGFCFFLSPSHFSGIIRYQAALEADQKRPLSAPGERTCEKFHVSTLFTELKRLGTATQNTSASFRVSISCSWCRAPCFCLIWHIFPCLSPIFMCFSSPIFLRFVPLRISQFEGDL